jgi:creatinine amidohydrolase
MAIRKLADMTWEEARDQARAGAIAILPVGAIEAHGPHLPLMTDVVIASAMAEAAAEELVDRRFATRRPASRPVLRERCQYRPRP